jgi:hydroxymethylpyrimidine pyrophosphatase-like HAD family hydrolase
MVTFDPRGVLEKMRVELPDALIAVEEPGVGFKVSKHFPDGELMGHSREVSWDELVAHPVTRVTLRQPESTAEEFMELVERAGLHGVSYAVGWSAWLDINPEGVSKASALELVRRQLRVEPIHTIACGDQRNDLEMLHWAAWGVAMGNAPHEVKAIADEVTGHVDEDGLAPILEAVAQAARDGIPFRDGVESAATARLEL